MGWTTTKPIDGDQYAVVMVIACSGLTGNVELIHVFTKDREVSDLKCEGVEMRMMGVRRTAERAECLDS